MASTLTSTPTPVGPPPTPARADSSTILQPNASPNKPRAPSTNSSSLKDLPSSPHFFNGLYSLHSLPPSLLSHYTSHRSELEVFDSHIRRKAADLRHKLDDIDVVVGIPFYTEITNIISVLVTLKEVFQQRRQHACLLVIGEFSRSDLVESIPLHQLEDHDDDEEEDEDDGSGRGRRRSYVHIETFWKPHPKYASKPFTVRALQVMADSANAGHGAHLIIMDADIQFNHWELSAMSLMRALLDPLMQLKGKKEDGTDYHNLHTTATTADSSTSSSRQPSATVLSTLNPTPSNPPPRKSSTSSFHPQYPLRDLDRPPPASFVLLNAPRSFIADDALIHLFSYLMTYAYTGQHIHQSHGGEFSIHRQLNRALLADESIVYRGCYCVEAQMVCRALHEEEVVLTAADTAGGAGGGGGGGGAASGEGVQEYGGYVLEMLMKGKWHAKINLNKLLQLDANNSARLDLVTEKVFTDAILFSSLGLHSTPGAVHLRTGGLTKTPNPDPNQQSMKVLCPVATKKEILLMIKSYYVILLGQQADGSLPIDSSIVQELIPLLHSKLAKLPGEKGWNHVVNQRKPPTPLTTPSSHAHPSPPPPPSGKDKSLVFGPDEWAKYTMEVVKIFLSAYQAVGSDADRVRQAKVRAACVGANRIVWLLGALAFLNEHSTGSWGVMHESMHRVYAPVFRKRFLVDIMGLSGAEAEETVRQETANAQQQ